MFTDYQFMQNNPLIQMQSTPATSVMPFQSNAPSALLSSTHALLAHPSSRQPSYTANVPSTQTPYTIQAAPVLLPQYGFRDFNQQLYRPPIYYTPQQLYQQEQFYKQQFYQQKQLYQQQLNKQKELKRLQCNLCLVKKQTKSHFTYNKYNEFHPGTTITTITSEFHSIGKNYNNYENENILLLKSDSLIDRKYGQELLQLIKPLQKNKFNYKKPRFVMAQCEPKPKLQTIVSQIQHYRHYKSLNKNTQVIMTKEVPIGFTPAIFSLKQHKFVNEINGLLYKDNIELYSVIGNIFTQFLPMFECLLDMKLNEYNYTQLSVIIKIQDFQFDNVNQINGRWHGEGDINDNIIGVGIYYFDVTKNNKLKFDENRLEIAEKEISSSDLSNIAKINLCNNDCIVFRNSQEMQHRAVISSANNTITDRNDRNDRNKAISRKILTFFVMDPNNINVLNHNANDFKFINFPWKVDIFVTHFIGYDMHFYNEIPSELIWLIKIFTFGSEEYSENEKVEYQLNIQPRLDTQSKYNPFYPPIFETAAYYRPVNPQHQVSQLS